MKTPIEIMDEIERENVPRLRPGMLVLYPDWQQLRAAIEAQAEELAHIEAELSAGQGDDDGDQILPDFHEDATAAQKVGECLHLLEVRRDVIEAQRKTLQIKDEELVHLRAGSARVWKKLAQKDERIAWLEAQVKAAMDFDEGSAAALKAEALRWAISQADNFYDGRRFISVESMQDAIDRIEREAKEDEG